MPPGAAAQHGRLGPDRYLAAIAAESQSLRDAAAIDLSAPVASCPGWDCHDLLGHVGTLHRRVGAMVSSAEARRVDAGELGVLPFGAERLGWFAEGAEALVAALLAAGTEGPCWTLDEPVGIAGFWFRRMAQETLVHRVDAELCHGGHGAVAPDLGADGIDELFARHLPRRLGREPQPGLAARLLFVAEDIGATFRVDLEPTEVRYPAYGEADTVARAATGELLLFLWNRAGAEVLEIQGLGQVLREWAATVRL